MLCRMHVRELKQERKYALHAKGAAEKDRKQWSGGQWSPLLYPPSDQS